MAILAALVVVSWPCYSQAQASNHSEPVFRAPFTLKLHVDREHLYEEKFDKVPYVAGDDVYLFAGDSFGIDIATTHGRVSRISYQPDPAKADLEFSFSQHQAARGFEMMLVIQNRLKHRLFLDALMTMPEKRGIYKTDILPVPPGLADYESWPHPIVQLVLRNFRLSEETKQPAAHKKLKGEVESVDPNNGNLRLEIPVVAAANPRGNNGQAVLGSPKVAMKRAIGGGCRAVNPERREGPQRGAFGTGCS